MAKTQTTTTTEPLTDERGSSAVINGDCYVKSTTKTSTWKVPESGISTDEACSAVKSGLNVIKPENIDWSKSGMYCGFGPNGRPRTLLGSGNGGVVHFPSGDTSKNKLIDFELNPFMKLEDGEWKFKYDHGEIDDFPWINSNRPQNGFLYQFVVAFKEPIDVPANTDVHWWWQKKTNYPQYGGPPSSMNSAHNRIPPNGPVGGNTVSEGGFYTHQTVSQIPVKMRSWGNCVCCPLPYYTNPNINWKEDGLRGVRYMVSPNLYTGCGPTQVLPTPNGVQIRMLAMGMTGPPTILTEGTDF